MVSKAKLDFPDPDSPVNTISEFRGSSTEMFFRLCSLAPLTINLFACAVLLLAALTLLTLYGCLSVTFSCFRVFVFS